MKETIKQIWKIHKQNKTGDFFDENGIIKDEKLAKLTEDIVVKNAYSPRTFNSMLNYDILDEHSSKEHGWRGDMLKSGVQKLSLLGLSTPETLFNYKFSKELYEHNKLYQKENQEIKNFLNTDTKSMSPDLALLTDFAKLQMHFNNIGDQTINDIVKQNVQEILPAGHIPENAQKKLVSDLCYFAKNELEYSNKKEQGLKEDLTTFFCEAGKFAEKYHSHPHFAELLTKMSSYDDVWKMLDTQTQNPKANVWDTGIQNPQNTEKRFGFASFIVASQINDFSKFSDKYDKSGVLKNELISTYTQTPEKLLDENYQQQIMQKFMPQEKQTEFKKQAELMFGAAWYSHITNRENPQYTELLQKMSTVPTNEVYGNVTRILENDRKRAAANQTTPENGNQPQGKTEVVAPVQTVKENANTATAENSAEAAIYGRLKELNEFANKHNKNGVLASILIRTFVKNDNKMESLAYWGNIAKEFADINPDKKNEFVKDMSVLMPKILKDIRANKDTPVYQQVKETIGKETLASDMLNKAESLAINKANQKESMPQKTPSIDIASLSAKNQR